MKNFIHISIILFSAACNSGTKTSTAIQVNPLDSLLKGLQADFSVAVIGPEANDTFNYHADEHMVMMSVVKFPQAVALLNLVDKGLLSLDSVIFFDSMSLKRDTWSPLSKDHPYGDVRMTLRECFNYSVGVSDNIVCDRLYELLSCQDVTKYIQSLGIRDFNISKPYKELDINNLGVNYTSGRAMALLLAKLRDKSILSDSSRAVLLEVMTKTETGMKRLKGMLPAETVVAHKTGTYFENDSFITAINDVGIVTLPNGKQYCIAVIVNNSKLGEAGTEKAIAEINKTFYDLFDARK